MRRLHISQQKQTNDLFKPNTSISLKLTAEKKQHLVCESYGDMGCQVSE